MTKFPELFASLAREFEPHEVKVRSQGGRQLHYITARTAMNRLDSVLGPENWWDEYVPAENSVLCKLTIRLPDGSTITKADAGGCAGMADAGDDDKSGYSDAFKRAAAKFGVSRYLYRDGVPAFVREREPGVANPPVQQQPQASPPPRAYSPDAQPANRYDGQPPRSGKALFAWCKDREKEHDVALVNYLNGWAKLQDLPSRMIDWDADQVALGHTEALRKLGAIQPAASQAPPAPPSGGAATTPPSAADITKARIKLTETVWHMTRARCQVQNPGDTEFWRSVAQLDRLVPSGVPIDINACNDLALLKLYTENAGEILKLGAGAAA